MMEIIILTIQITEQIGIKDPDYIDEGVMHFREVELRPPSRTLLKEEEKKTKKKKN